MVLLILCQVVYLMSFIIVDKEYLRPVVDPFQCEIHSGSSRSTRCVSPRLAILVDWFIATLSILVPFLTTQLLEEVYFVYHYMHYMKIFLLYRITTLSWMLPVRGLPMPVVGVLAMSHLCCLALITRLIYALSSQMGQGKNLIAIQFNFGFLTVEIVKVHKSVNGSDLKVSPAIEAGTCTDVCPICYETLLIPSRRCLTDSIRIFPRFNIAATRAKVHGKVDLFVTNCNHCFHRDCLMKWISGKPIRVDLSPGQGHRSFPGRSLGATCPVCGRPIHLKMTRRTINFLQLIFR